MRQIFLDRGDIYIKTVPTPTIQDHTVVIATHYSLVASTQEIALFIKNQPTILDHIPRKVKKVLSSVIPKNIENLIDSLKNPETKNYNAFGSSCSGRVIAIGSQVKNVRVGDWVSCFGQEYAYHADVVSAPEHCVVKLPDNKWLKIGALTGYGTRAIHMVHGSSVMVGETVAVLIHDLFGFLLAQLCLKAGARVIGILAHQSLWDYAQQYAMNTVLLASDETITTAVALLTANHGVDATFVPSYHPSFSTCDPVLITRRKGRVIIGGQTIENHSSLALHKELRYSFFSTYGAGADESYYEKGCDYPFAHVRWTEQRNAQAFISSIMNNSLDDTLYDFPEYRIEDIGLKKNKAPSHNPLALYITYGQNGKDSTEFTVQPAVKDTTPFIHTTWTPIEKSKIRVGIVGAPKLAQPLFTPYICSLRSINVVAVADEDIADALNLAHTVGAKHVYRTLGELLNEQSVDAIMVTSPYKQRISDVVYALSLGKAVYVEKPMATSMDDLNILEHYAHQAKILPLCVDHYRLYSPLVERIREVTSKRSGPLMIQYRMNSSATIKEDFIQIDRGAGRIVSDASHIIHLFCALTQAEPVAISVEALHSIERNLFPTDNFMVIITFSDGSLCQLLHTVIGHTNLGSERMELFFDGKSIILDDYTALYGFGTPSWFNTTLIQQDKGHKTLLKTFFSSLKQEQYVPIFSWKELYESTRLTLLIDQLACQGGGTKT